MNRILVTLISIIFIFTGCGTMPNIPNDFVVDFEKEVKEGTINETLKNYEVSKQKFVYVGESLVEKALLRKYYKDVYYIKFQSNMDYKDIRSDMIYDKKGYSKKNKDVKYVFILEDEGNYRYLKLDEKGNLLSKDLFDSFGNVVIPSYIQNGSLRFEPILLKDESKSTIQYLDGSFKFELLYNGKEGNNIKISYREYSNDMARLAFFQSLTYNLKESRIIRYKNIRIKVINATNEKISFIVLED